MSPLTPVRPRVQRRLTCAAHGRRGRVASDTCLRCRPKLAEIVDEFVTAPRELVLEMLLEFSDAVPPLPAEMSGHEGMEQVPECQTPFFLRAEVRPTTPWRRTSTARRRRRRPGRSPGSSPRAWRGRAPQEVLAVPDDLYTRMGLAQAISPLRVRGGTAVLGRLKRQVREQVG